MTHQTHRVTYPLVEHISIATLQLNLLRRESRVIVVDLVQKNQNKKGSTLGIHSYQDLQQRHTNPSQRHDNSKEGVQTNNQCGDRLHMKRLHQNQKTGASQSLRALAHESAIKQTCSPGTTPATEQDCSKELHQSCHRKKRRPRQIAAPTGGSALTLTEGRIWKEDRKKGRPHQIEIPQQPKKHQSNTSDCGPRKPVQDRKRSSNNSTRRGRSPHRRTKKRRSPPKPRLNAAPTRGSTPTVRRACKEKCSRGLHKNEKPRRSTPECWPRRSKHDCSQELHRIGRRSRRWLHARRPHRKQKTKASQDPQSREEHNRNHGGREKTPRPGARNETSRTGKNTKVGTGADRARTEKRSRCTKRSEGDTEGLFATTTNRAYSESGDNSRQRGATKGLLAAKRRTEKTRSTPKKTDTDTSTQTRPRHRSQTGDRRRNARSTSYLHSVEKVFITEEEEQTSISEGGKERWVTRAEKPWNTSAEEL